MSFLLKVLGMELPLWVARKREFLVFFNFSFIGEKLDGDEKREIDFLHFLSIFGQIFVIFDDFSKFHNVVRAFHFKIWQKVGKKMKKSLAQKFLQVKN